ncbi:hypothetical protein AB9E28_35530, partial [Rhizobium leguminosarum]|uniref:hypothetical protein n=1 Tax=Rhizobium leguminosarum TaxID=384 RepID=UPI003F9CAFE9
MAQPPALPIPKVAPSLRYVGFALGIIGIICILFLPIPPFLIHSATIRISTEKAIEKASPIS